MPEGLSIAVALLAMRLVAAILFFFQGYDKVFLLKTEGFLRVFADALAKKKIPLSLARLTISISSFIELAGGVLLALGLFREPVLYVLAAELVCVAFAFSVLKPMWDLSYFFPRFLLIVALLLLPAAWDTLFLARLF